MTTLLDILRGIALGAMLYYVGRGIIRAAMILWIVFSIGDDYE